MISTRLMMNSSPTLRMELMTTKKTREKLGYHRRLKRMIAKVKKETKWRDIFKIVSAAQKRLK